MLRRVGRVESPLGIGIGVDFGIGIDRGCPQSRGLAADRSRVTISIPIRMALRSEVFPYELGLGPGLRLGLRPRPGQSSLTQVAAAVLLIIRVLPDAGLSPRPGLCRPSLLSKRHSIPTPPGTSFTTMALIRLCHHIGSATWRN